MNQKKGVDVPHLLSHWTIGSARRSLFAVGAAFVVGVTACSSDSATGPNSSSAVGSYTVSTVNGKTIPTSIIAEGTYSIDFTGGSIKITNDGKFFTVTNTRQTLPGSVENFVDTVGGSWTQSGNTLQMTFDEGTTATATTDKGTLTGTFSYLGVSLTVVYGNKK